MDCKGCGCCCYLQEGSFLDVTLLRGEEIRIPEALFTKRAGGPSGTIANWMKRRPNGSCVALDETTKLCTIHDIRPAECHLFPQGHTRCVEALKKHKR